MAKAKSKARTEGAAEETLTFQTEVSRLLDIVANALYSNHEIFLRELISNASDSCDRLRYLAITAPDLLEGDTDFRVVVTPDGDAGTLTIEDNGLGMDREELATNLGTIARSGSAAFLDALGRSKGDEAVSLIGQFGVGFYSAFTVADKVEVVTRKAGEPGLWRWASDGKGEFTIGSAEGELPRGARITLTLKADRKEFLDPSRLRHIVRTYSDHIGLPILLRTDGGEETLNEASALWTQPKADITEEQYKEFYKHVAHAFDDPWEIIHNRVEGVIEYTNLLFVPSAAPFDLFEPERGNRLKLYVKRVFITDRCDDLLPPYLRFVRGLVDCEDLPLNVSRELLQSNAVVRKIKSGLTKRILDALVRRSEAEDGDYPAFWRNFGPVLKEGLYEDSERREALLKLARFRSTTTADDSLTSLSEYVARAKDGQTAIHYITAETEEAARQSPQLEGFRAKGVEVLLLTDPVDEFWLPAISEFEGKPFKSVTRGGADLSGVSGGDEQGDEASKPDDDRPDDADGAEKLVAMFKLALMDEVKNVRASERLTESAVCLVADEGDMDINLERMLRQHKKLERSLPRILEINPRHALIRKLKDSIGRHDDMVEDAAQLLLDQARIAEGEPVRDAAAFAGRMARFMERGLG